MPCDRGSSRREFRCVELMAFQIHVSVAVHLKPNTTSRDCMIRIRFPLAATLTLPHQIKAYFAFHVVGLIRSRCGSAERLEHVPVIVDDLMRSRQSLAARHS